MLGEHKIKVTTTTTTTTTITTTTRFIGTLVLQLGPECVVYRGR